MNRKAEKLNLFADMVELTTEYELNQIDFRKRDEEVIVFSNVTDTNFNAPHLAIVAEILGLSPMCEWCEKRGRVILKVF